MGDSHDPQQRPRGLKRSVAAAASASAEAEAQPKRVREEADGAEAEAEEIEFVLGEGDDLDPFEQAEAILQAALECLEEGDEAHGRSLLQGAVHECDGLVASKPDEAASRPSIYRVFGDALRHLGLLLKKEDFFEAADRRYVTALTHAPGDVRAAVMRARNEVDSATVAQALDDVRTMRFKERLQAALDSLPKDAGEERETAVALVDALGHEILDAADAFEGDLAEAFVGLARHTFQRLQVAEPEYAAALAGQGACDRSLAVAELPSADVVGGAKILRSAIQMAQDNDAQVARFSVWLAELLLTTETDEAFAEAKTLLNKAREIDPDLVSAETLAELD